MPSSSKSLKPRDGLLFHVYGPVEGRRHDLTLYRWANMDVELERTFQMDYRNFCAYGDSAYLLRTWLQIELSGDVTPEQAAFNTEMSALRVSVEWVFKDIKTMFSHLTFSRQQKAREGPVGLLFLVSCYI